MQNVSRFLLFLSGIFARFRVVVGVWEVLEGPGTIWDDFVRFLKIFFL